jgi:hypothetical protein
MKRKIIYFGLILLAFLVGYNLAILKVADSLTMKVQFEPMSSDSLQNIMIQEARDELRKSRPEIESWFVTSIQKVDSGAFVNFSGTCGEKTATISGGILSLYSEFSIVEDVSFCSPTIDQFVPKIEYLVP